MERTLTTSGQITEGLKRWHTGSKCEREAIAEQWDRLACHCANRYGGTDDLVQVARIGLVKALDRFDPRSGYNFTTFATPTIIGELKRYFRDHGWSIHVPRGLQDTAIMVGKARELLAHRYGKEPTVLEIAEATGLPEAKVAEAIGLEDRCRPLSLDYRAGDDEGDDDFAATIAGVDELEPLEMAVAVRQTLDRLAPEHRELLIARYFERASQRELSRRYGCNQMAISRRERIAKDAFRSVFLGMRERSSPTISPATEAEIRRLRAEADALEASLPVLESLIAAIKKLEAACEGS